MWIRYKFCVSEREMQEKGYPAYITSCGWLGYSDEQITSVRWNHYMSIIEPASSIRYMLACEYSENSKSIWTSAQSDQSLSLPPEEEKLDNWLPIECPSKTDQPVQMRRLICVFDECTYTNLYFMLKTGSCKRSSWDFGTYGMCDIGVDSITQLCTCVIKIVTFKGDHQLW